MIKIMYVSIDADSILPLFMFFEILNGRSAWTSEQRGAGEFSLQAFCYISLFRLKFL